MHFSLWVVVIVRLCPLANCHLHDILTSLSSGSCQIVNFDLGMELKTIPHLKLDHTFDSKVITKLNSPKSCWNVIVSKVEDVQKIKQVLSTVRSIILVSNEVVPLRLEFELYQYFKNGQYQDNLVLHCSGSMTTKFIHIKDLGRAGACPFHFLGQEIQISYRGLPPFILEGPHGVYGVDMDIVQILSDTLGFHFKVQLEKQWGVLLPNGTWIGTLGSVQKKSSMIGVGHLTIQYDYFQAVDFSHHLYNLDVLLVAPKPKPLKSYYNLLQPFPPLVWLLVVIAWIFATLVLWEMIQIQRDNNLAHNIKEPAMFTFRTMFSESIYFRETNFSFSDRCFYLFWVLGIFFVSMSYQCNLRASLISTVYEPAIDSEKDLLDQGRRLFLPSGQSSLLTSLRESPKESQQMLYKQIVENDQFFEYVNGMRKLEVEQAMIANGDAFVWTEHFAKAGFARIEERYGYQPFRLGKSVITSFHGAFVFPKNQMWADDVNHILSRLMEAGIIERTFRKYFPLRYIVKEQPPVEHVEPFDLFNIIGGILVLAAGWAVSGFAFIFEFLFCPG